jgi:hypothetical protein
MIYTLPGGHDPQDLDASPSFVGTPSMPPSYRIDRYTTEQLAAADPAVLGEWERCLARGRSGAVFLHPALVRSGTPGYKGSQVVTMTGPQGTMEGLAVLAPKTVQVKPLGRLGPKVALKGYWLVGDQVITPDDTAAIDSFVHGLCDALNETDARTLLIEELTVESPLRLAIQRVVGARRGFAAHQHLSPIQPHYLIRFPDNPADYWKKFSGKTRSTLRRKANKFEHRIVKYTSAADIPEFLEKAHRISQASWQTKRLGPRVKNSSDEREELTRIANLGGFRSYTLDHNGVPIAFLLGNVYQGVYRYEEVGYDQMYTANSPGTLLLYRAIEDLVAHDTPHTLDFGFGDADYKRLFATEWVLTGPLLLVRRSLGSRAAIASEQVVAWLDRRARAALGRIGLLNVLRRRHRRVSRAASTADSVNPDTDQSSP